MNFADAYNRYAELNTPGRYREALPFAETAVRLSEREYGPEHRNSGTALNNLAEIYFRLGRYAEAGLFEAIAMKAGEDNVVYKLANLFTVKM